MTFILSTLFSHPFSDNIWVLNLRDDDDSFKIIVIMPYLRLSINGQVMDETYISDILVQSVIGTHIIEEEKQKMLEKHRPLISQPAAQFSFTTEQAAAPALFRDYTSSSKKHGE